MIKLPSISLPPRPTVLGGSAGTRAIVLHEVTGRSDPKINEETALLPQTISASQDPLRGIGISGAPNGRIINMTDRGGVGRRGGMSQG